MSRPRAYLFDLDGTVYRGSEPCPHAGDVLGELCRAGFVVRYLTNNSAARPDQVTHKLHAMGIPCEPEWVISSTHVAAEWCLSNGVSRVAGIGELGLFQTLHDSGVEAISAEECDSAEALVVGICRSFTYAMMSAGLDLVRRGATFVATNRDATYPLEGGRFQPGAGALVASLETCTGVTPLVMGKPQPAMISLSLAGTGISAAEALMVGDRRDTDIACGLAAGCPTWLVLTGVETELMPGESGSPDLRGLLC